MSGLFLPIPRHANAKIQKSKVTPMLHTVEFKKRIYRISNAEVNREIISIDACYNVYSFRLKTNLHPPQVTIGITFLAKSIFPDDSSLASFNFPNIEAYEGGLPGNKRQ